MNNKKYYDIFEEYLDKCLTENGYNKLFLQAKQIDDAPSLYLISFLFLVQFFMYKEFDQYPNDECITEVLKKCREINKLKIQLFADGSWNKELYFSFIKDTIKATISKPIEFVSFDKPNDFLDHSVSLYQNTTGKQAVVRKSLYPTFDDVVGLDKAKQVVKERVIEPTIHKDIYEKYDVQIGGGILLFGLPGTGKTMFAQAVANEIKGYFINIKSSDIKSKWFGETENKIKEIFDEAKKHKVSVIFFDEFEAIGVSRDKLGSEVTAASVVPELLSQMQGFEKNDNILLFIAATNRPWDIDSALLRPGRLDYLVYVDLPNYDCRLLMINNNLKNINAPDDIKEYLAKATEYYNGSDIKNICDKLIRVVIQKEIDGIKDYELQFEDCVSVLKEIRSSVIPNDYRRMMEFCKNYNV